MKPSPQSELRVQASSATVQLMVVDDPQAATRGLWLLGEPTQQWGLSVPRDAFPWLEAGMVVNLGTVLTVFSIVPVKEPALITPDGRDLKSQPLIIPGKPN